MRPSTRPKSTVAASASRDPPGGVHREAEHHARRGRMDATERSMPAGDDDERHADREDEDHGVRLTMFMKLLQVRNTSWVSDEVDADQDEGR